MQFTTPVEINYCPLSVQHDSSITLLGSCFAQHVGNKMSEAGLDAHVNPFGVIYNPYSLMQVVEVMCRLASDGAGETCHVLPPDCFFPARGQWHCWWLDSSFSAMTQEECMQRTRNAFCLEAERLKKLDYLFVTLGTPRYYALKADGLVVGNCHKMPGALFEEKQLTVDEAVCRLEHMVQAVKAVNEQVKVVFTVSPYRYAKYGFHESQLGKAILLLAVDRVIGQHPQECFYFPAYEIVLDELRDYRFFEADMLHPSAQAVDYIWQQFSSVCLSPSCQAFIKEWESVNRALQHRPFNEQSEEHQKFLVKTLLKAEQLNAKYPNFASEKAILQLKSKIEHIAREMK